MNFKPLTPGHVAAIIGRKHRKRRGEDAFCPIAERRLAGGKPQEGKGRPPHCAYYSKYSSKEAYLFELCQLCARAPARRAQALPGVNGIKRRNRRLLGLPGRNLGGTAGLPVPCGQAGLFCFQGGKSYMKKILLGLLGTAWALLHMVLCFTLIWGLLEYLRHRGEEG